MNTTVTVINEGDTTEIQWGVGADDCIGYIMVHPDGTATFPHGDGVVIFLAGEDTRVCRQEHQYSGVEPGEDVIWHINEEA